MGNGFPAEVAGLAQSAGGRIAIYRLCICSLVPFGRMEVGYLASAPSASSVQLERLFQSGRRIAQARHMSFVADAADDADGVTGLGLTHGRYRDCPRPQPTLAAEGNLNSDGAEEGLRPAQPASECARAYGRPSAMGASKALALQEARAAASHPTHVWHLTCSKRNH